MMKMTVKRLKYGNPKDAVEEGKKVSNLMIGVAIANQAKLLAPVKYGQLRNSLSASNTKETRALNNRPGEQAEPLDTSGLTGDDVLAGSNSDHAIFQEYGTIKQPAQPFLRPATELIIQRKDPAEIVAKYNREAMEKEFKSRGK